MSDLPDFTNYSQVDLVQQTIAFLTNRPMYGEAKRVYGSKLIDPQSRVTLVKIAGKGKIYGGCIFADTDHKVENDMIYICIDWYAVLAYEWNWFIRYNQTRINDFVAWATCYDDVNYIYNLAFMSDLTFEEDVEFEYSNKTSNSVYVGYEIIYSLLNV